MTHTTTIIYLTGKYGFIVCDNQLINNPIFELLQYGGYAKTPDFACDTIARIRTEVFDFLAKSAQNNHILINSLADTDYESYKMLTQR